MTPEEIAERKSKRAEENAGKMKLWIIPATVAQANAFVENMHRQHHPVVSCKFAIACIDSTGLVHGVAIIGHPVARMLDDGLSCEVTRCCTDGTPNAPSALYGAAWRTARGMGYRSMYTYTLGEAYNETGGSLRAMGWQSTEGVGGNTWNHASRSSKSGIDKHPLDKKVRWEVHAEDFFPVAEIVWPVFTSGEVQYSETIFGEPTVEGKGAAVEYRKTKRAKLRNNHASQSGQLDNGAAS